MLLRGDGAHYSCDALIIATGASARYLGLPSEEKFRGRGVSACATCDGFFFRGHRVAVVGGGNTAVEEALYLSIMAAHVTLIHRRDRLRAEKILQDRLHASASARAKSACCGITASRRFSAMTPASTACGYARPLDNARARDRRHGHLHRHRPHAQYRAVSRASSRCAAATSDVKGGSEGDATATSLPGVFAAGDVADHVYRQAITSAGSGCMAALDADRYLEQFDVARLTLRARQYLTHHPLRSLADQWNALAAEYPFLRHEFLCALEDSGCASPAQRLDAAAPGAVRRARPGGRSAAVPQDAFLGRIRIRLCLGARAPSSAACIITRNCVCAIPFTPATGPRLLCRPDLPAHARRARSCCSAMRERAQAARLSIGACAVSR